MRAEVADAGGRDGGGAANGDRDASYPSTSRITFRAGSLSALVEDDLFSYLSFRFLNYLIEEFARKRTSMTDVLLGCCLAELRARKLRMEFSTYEVIKTSFPNQKFQFKFADRGFVTPEVAKPVGAFSR